MRRIVGRRSLFFLVLTVLCLVMVPPTPPEFRWVAWGAAGLAFFWAVLLGLEDLTRPQAERRDEVPTEVEMPFAPPPPPGRSPG
jgi:hypothetical protein